MQFSRAFRPLLALLALVIPSGARAELQLVRQWQAAPVLLQSVEFSPDGSLLVTASGGGVAQLWSPAGEPGPLLKGQRPPMFKAHFSFDGNQLITTGYDGTAWLWSLKGERLDSFSLHKAATADVRFLPESHPSPPGYVSSSDDGQVVIRGSDARPLWSTQFTGTARQLAVNLDGSLIVASSDDGQLHLIQPAASHTSARVRSVPTSHGRMTRLSFSPDQQRIASAGIDGKVSVWSPAGQQQLSLQASTKGWSRGAVYCNNASGNLLTIGDDGVVREWSSSGHLMDSLPLTNTSSLTSVDCANDGRHVAVVGSKGELWLLSYTATRP